MIKNSDQQRNKFFNITFHNRNINESQSSQRSQRFRTPVIINPEAQPDGITNPDQRGAVLKLLEPSGILPSKNYIYDSKYLLLYLLC